MALRITAKIDAISGIIPIELNGVTYQKQSILVYQIQFNQETGEPETADERMLFEFFGNSVSELAKCKVGDTVMIYFKLRGGEFTDKEGKKKVTTRINPTKVVKVGASQPTEQPTPSTNDPSDDVPPPPPSYAPQGDGLPF